MIHTVRKKLKEHKGQAITVWHLVCSEPEKDILIDVFADRDEAMATCSHLNGGISPDAQNELLRVLSVIAHEINASSDAVARAVYATGNP